MAFESKNARADMAYPYHIDNVFDAALAAAQNCRMSIVSADRFNHVIYISKTMSFWTWGESINVYLGVLADGRTGLTVVSSSCLGFEIAAKSQNQKNVQEFLNALNALIPGGVPNQMFGSYR